MRKNLPCILSCLFFATVLQQKAFSQAKGPSSSQTPYVLPVASGVQTKSILSVPDVIGSYTMCGIPDGLGAFDNGDGTFTLLMNHEFGNTAGIARAHGANGAFVSSWIINKSTLSVMSGSDLMQNIYGWNTATQSSNTTTSTIAFNRFCSADLPPASAFYNAATGMGSTAKIFMHGEEGGATGYQLASVGSGPNKGKTYILGKFNLSTNGSGLTGVGAWENALANPYAQNKTVVIGNNDGGTGIMSNALAVYVGTKTNTGSEVDKAGLTNGTLKFVNVTGNAVEIINNTTRATNITSGTSFTLSATSSTTFSRPEDGVWNPLNPGQYFFVTTDRLDQVADGIGTQVGRSRLWRLTFTDITNPDLGGTIDLLLDGTEGHNMLDNITADHWGHLLILEDVGGAPHNGKIWQYTIATDELKLIAKHDPARFGDIVNGVINPATSPYNNDEETSGIIDVQEILGAGWFLFVDQAHYGITNPAEVVEGGQLMALYNPDTYNACSNYPGTISVSPSPTVNGQLSNTIYLGYGPQSVTLTASAPTGVAPYTYSWSPGGTTTNSLTVSPTATTTYTATIKNAFGCAISVSKTITVNDIRDGDKSKVFICHNGNSISVSVNAVPAHLAHGDQLGTCEAESITSRSILNAENEINNSAAVYPNPASGHTFITINPAKDELVSITMYDATGKNVMKSINKTMRAGNQLVELNVNGFKNGIYYVQIKGNVTKATLKLVVLH
jgi:hypothetical protein